MKRRLIRITLRGWCLGVLLLSRAWGLEVTSSGTFVDEVTSQQGTWGGRFQVKVSSFTGLLTFSAPGQQATTVPVRGSFNAGRVAFGSMDTKTVAAAFDGSWSLTEGSSGTFTFGNRRGSWKGNWGSVGAGVPPAAAAPPDAEPLPMFQNTAPPAGMDPNDPRSTACALLQDERVMTLISAAGERALRTRCSGTAQAGLQDSSRLWALFADGPFDFLGLRAALVGTASAAPGANILVNNRSLDIYPNVTQSEVSIGVSTSNPTTPILVAGYNDRDAAHNSYTGYARSTDSGATWTDLGFLPPPPSAFNWGDPVVNADQLGTFYFGHLASTTQFGPLYIGVSRSTNGGVSFGTPVNASPAAGVDGDKEEMGVDRFTQTSPFAGNIYACWTDFGLGGIRFSRSINQGASYAQLGSSLSAGTFSVQGCAVSVGSQGNVYVAWWDATANTGGPANTIRVRRSTNGGVSFGAEVAIGAANAAAPPPSGGCGRPQLNGNIRNQPFANIATDPLASNNVYTAWNTYVAGSSEVQFSRSTDAGLTWSAPVRLNDTTTNDQFMPRLTTSILFEANPNVTQIRVAWYDRRLSGNNTAVDIFADVSGDGGQTFGTDVRWTDTSSPLPQLLPNFDSNFIYCYFGDYNAHASLNPANSSSVVVGWGDTRLPIGPQNSPDPDVRSSVGC